MHTWPDDLPADDDLGTWSHQHHPDLTNPHRELGFRATPWQLDENLPAPPHEERDPWIGRAIRLVVLVALAIGLLAYVSHIGSRTAANVERNLWLRDEGRQQGLAGWDRTEGRRR